MIRLGNPGWMLDKDFEATIATLPARDIETVLTDYLGQVSGIALK